MKRILSMLSVCCLCCLVMFVTSDTPADAKAASSSKVCICHIPPGNPSNAHTICIGEPAVRAHLRHGDTMGECSIACGGDTGVTCATGSFCQRDEGVCGTDAEGVCTKIPATCPTTVSPVCGCDGTTYDNACLAAKAGVTVSNTGECVGGGVCGGTEGVTCDDGQFCKRPDGACTAEAEGICTDNPVICGPEFAPVCGCDGTTYSNACFADAAGVAVDSTGACTTGVACSDNATCATGEFCESLVGDCTEVFEGACTTIPLTCSTILARVCGCDSISYDNACLAAAASVGVAHSGPCAGDTSACGGASGATCATGEICKRPDGACASDASGFCQPAPVSCPALVDPACGCNGTTYSNACVADAAAVTIASDGACEPSLACGGGSGLVCPEGQFCKAPTAACVADSAGLCTPIPDLCPTVVTPVCGCDGTTYSNECFADAAGVTVNHTGACP
jgi:hypothetical protein